MIYVVTNIAIACFTNIKISLLQLCNKVNETISVMKKIAKIVFILNMIL